MPEIRATSAPAAAQLACPLLHPESWIPPPSASVKSPLPSSQVTALLPPGAVLCVSSAILFTCLGVGVSPVFR